MTTSSQVSLHEKDTTKNTSSVKTKHGNAYPNPIPHTLSDSSLRNPNPIQNPETPLACELSSDNNFYEFLVFRHLESLRKRPPSDIIFVHQ